MANFFKRYKKSILVSTLVISIGFGAVSFKEDYFELSKNLEIFTTLYRDINIYYVDDTKPGELMKKGIDAMLESLDPYTVYIPESKIEDYRFLTTGSYGGIGATITQLDGIVYVADPYESSPALKSGLRSGDQLLEIDGVKITGKSTEEISDALKGQANTEVKLLIKPLGSESTELKKISREVIKLKDVPYSGMLNAEVGYIKLNSFTESASAEVKDAFVELKGKQGMKKLILDLRGNGGGLLREAVNIVNFFVPKGEMVVDTRGRIKEWDKVLYALNPPLDTEIPLIVLMDGNSASASEIVAGSLQDLDRAVIVGDRSYGKGLVQQTRDLSYNSKLKVTVAKYYIPSGRCIQKLDYTHRDASGEVTEVPDSLLKAFKTKGGRKVIDGRGIDPDVKIESEEFGKILQPLFEQGLFFKYTNQYVLKNAKIKSAKEFALNDSEYEAFVSFISTKKLEYTTETERALEQLKKIAGKEKYLQIANTEFEQLKQKLVPDTKGDLALFKSQVKLVLENEIVSRYFYDRGRVEATLSKDNCIEKALGTFAAPTYNGILSTSKK